MIKMKNKKIIMLTMTLVLVFVMMQNITAFDIPTGHQDANISLIQYCPTCTYVKISSVTYPDNTLVTLNKNMTDNGGIFNYTFNDTSQIGEYIYFVEGDKDGSIEGESLKFEVTPDGFDFSIFRIVSYVFLSLLFLIVGFVYYYFSKKINFDSLEKQVERKYDGKNRIKILIYGMIFGLLEEKFMVLYLLLLPTVLFMREITILASADFIYPILNTFSIIYGVGVLIIIVMFFGKIQEIIKMITEKIEDINWGLQ